MTPMAPRYQSVQPSRPRVMRILETDILAYLALLLILFVWFVTLIVEFREAIPLLQNRETFLQGRVDFYFVESALFTLPALAVLVWRILRVRGIFRRGRPVTGQISRLWVRREWVHVRYVYLVQGQRFEVRQFLLKNRRLLTMRAGTTITIRVDPTNPQRSLIQDLYL